MVKVREDLTGKIFGRLTVLEQAEDYIRPDGRHEAQWICECNCKKHTRKIISGYSLKKGFTQSCGCLQSEFASLLRKNSHKTNKYSDKLIDEYGEYYIGITTNTQKEFYVDAEDFDIVKNYCWSESIDHQKGYSWLVAWDDNIRKRVKMHQLVFEKYCDHNDRNTLNNRKYNLRPSTFSENTQNRGLFKNNKSGVTGVYWRSKEQMWQIYIDINKKKTHLGWCSNKEEAIKIRLDAEYKYYGEFAPQKHLFEKYSIRTQQNDLKKEFEE